jgi:hypothetical protein
VIVKAGLAAASKSIKKLYHRKTKVMKVWLADGEKYYDEKYTKVARLWQPIAAERIVVEVAEY